MSILRKPLADVVVGDLEHLIAIGARETSELEFKGEIPFKPDKGSTTRADRWIEKGDRIGDYGRDKLLSELVAFANAGGGTLVLGLHETGEEPKRAERLQPLPRCDDLARRIVDAAEDVVEPRLPQIASQALPINDQGDGYAVFRVGKSLAGPHRLKSTREFYLRRGERAASMDVREIRDLTLNLARSGDRVEEMLRERREVARIRFGKLEGPSATETGPFLVRVTALPLIPQSVPDLTVRPDLWWSGSGFTATVDNIAYPCGFPAREFGNRPQIRMRALEAELDQQDDGGAERLLRSDGLVEFRLVIPKREKAHGPSGRASLYIAWTLGLAVGVISQVQRLRDKLAWDGVTFGLEIELWSLWPIQLRWNDDLRSSRLDQSQPDYPMRLPQYEILAPGDFNELLAMMVRDLLNAWGGVFKGEISIPWDEVLPSRT